MNMLTSSQQFSCVNIDKVVLKLLRQIKNTELYNVEDKSNIKVVTTRKFMLYFLWKNLKTIENLINIFLPLKNNYEIRKTFRNFIEFNFVAFMNFSTNQYPASWVSFCFAILSNVIIPYQRY